MSRSACSPSPQVPSSDGSWSCPSSTHDRDTVVIEHEATRWGWSGDAGRGQHRVRAALVRCWSIPRTEADRWARGSSRGPTRWSSARASERPFDVRTACPAVDDDAHRLFESSGYEQVRISWDMAIELRGRRPTSGDLPGGVLVRASRRDETSARSGRSRSRRSRGTSASPRHPTNRSTPSGTRSADWDPSRVLLAEVEDGEVVGELAWVDAVARRLHREPRGLEGASPTWDRHGPAANGVRAHRRREVRRATLSVDTGNTSGAVELYRRSGWSRSGNRTYSNGPARVSLPDGYRIRPATVDNDLDAAVAILRACDLHDVGFADDVSDWIREDWVGSSHRGAWMVDGPVWRSVRLRATSGRPTHPRRSTRSAPCSRSTAMPAAGAA